jgi:hypothetical protein
MSSLADDSRDMARSIALVLLIGLVTGCATSGNGPGRNVLTDPLSEPLNGVTSAEFDINVGDGNLTIDGLTGGEELLIGGALEYLEKQGQPARTLSSFLGKATVSLQAGPARQRWFRLPWAACNGATEWQIHLNPDVSSDITAHTNGGNVELNLAGLAVTHVAADTGGGNVHVVLPDGVADLSVTAKTGAGSVIVEIGSELVGSATVKADSGAGSVVVYVPSGLAARIDATASLGKVIVDPQFSKIAGDTYESSGFDSAVNRAEITLSSGAGNVTVYSK